MAPIKIRNIVLILICLVLNYFTVHGNENHESEPNDILLPDNGPMKNTKHKYFNINTSLGTPYLFNIGAKCRVTKNVYIGTQLPLLPVCHLYIPKGMALEMGITSTNYLKNKNIYIDLESGIVAGKTELFFSSNETYYSGLSFNFVLGAKYTIMSFINISPVYLTYNNKIVPFFALGCGINI